MKVWIRAWRDDDGQDLVEYALLIAFIAFSCVAAVTALGGAIAAAFMAVAAQLSGGS